METDLVPLAFSTVPVSAEQAVLLYQSHQGPEKLEQTHRRFRTLVGD